jgi:hypothetical protein
MTVAERAKPVEALGFTPRQARFLTVVALHSGYCLRRQYAAFAGVRNAKNVGAFFHALVARGLAERTARRPDRGHIYHLHTRAVYRLVGQEESGLRRPASGAHIARTLMRLDYVLAHPEVTWLGTAEEKVAAFARLGVALGDLPQMPVTAEVPTVRYFVQRGPIGLVGDPPVPRIVALVTDGRARTFAQFLRAHAALLLHLPAWTLVAIAPRDGAALVACPEVLARVLHSPSAFGVSLDDVRWYLGARRAVDQAAWAALSVADLERFRALRDRLARPEVEALYRAWLTAGDAAVAAFAETVAAGALWRGRQLVTEVLPFDYSQFGSLPGVA